MRLLHFFLLAFRSSNDSLSKIKQVLRGYPLMVSCNYMCILVLCLLLINQLTHSKFIVVRRRKKSKRNGVMQTTDLPVAKSAKRDASIHSSSKPKVIICAVMKNEDRYVDEWIMYNKYLGFDFIQLYDNNKNGSAKIAYLPQKYGDFVRVQHLPGSSIQVKAYNMCAKQYEDEKYWAAFIDGDEFIVLRKHESIPHLLSGLDANVGALSINRIFFGSNGHLHYTNAPVLQRFTARKSSVDNYVKTIVYLPDAVRIDNHYARVKKGKLRVDCHNRVIRTESINNNTSEDVAAIYHYYTKSFDEFRAKRLRGDAYKSSRGTRYHENNGEVTILNEFLRFDKEANAVFDTRALEFFQKRHAEMPDFPPKQDVI